MRREHKMTIGDSCTGDPDKKTVRKARLDLIRGFVRKSQPARRSQL